MVRFFIFFVIFSNLFKLINSGYSDPSYTWKTQLQLVEFGFNCSNNNPFPYESSRPIIIIGTYSLDQNQNPLNLEDFINKKIDFVNEKIALIEENLVEFGTSFNKTATIGAILHLFELILSNEFTLIDAIYYWIGYVECRGADHCIGVFLFELLVLGTDFGGNSVCKLCSAIIRCIEYKGIHVAPLSLYPWGCKCDENGCDEYGPKNTRWSFPLTKKFCMPNYECTEWCNSQPERKPEKSDTKYYKGYICNWWNFFIEPAVCILINPLYSPIRWCECCPVSGQFYQSYQSQNYKFPQLW